MEQKICNWKIVDNGMYGFQDLEYQTSCGKTLDADKTNRTSYCPYCGNKTKIITWM